MQSDSSPLFQRDCGILLHPTSLPGQHGIGSLGPEAERWLEVLHQAGQSLWQVLPLTPPGDTFSPYQGRSSFAGDARLISLSRLVEDGWLSADALLQLASSEPGKVDFPTVASVKDKLLKRAAERFLDAANGSERDNFHLFCEKNRDWLEDFARFEALSEQQGGRPWFTWPRELRDREVAALQRSDELLAEVLARHKVIQFFFEQQWARLHARAQALGIRVVGDLPIFVAHNSSDVWTRPELFHLDGSGQPSKVAGVPPDYFSKEGQRWGNPLYDWPQHEAEGFRWWARRLSRTLELTDLVRIDHFRGFAACWEIPAEEPTAIQGRWVEAPGDALFTSLQEQLGKRLSVIAEDLGIITDDVVALRERFGFPTMRVLQFSFSGEDQLLPHHYPDNCVAFTGTHDNNTTVGWYTDPPGVGQVASAETLAKERDRVRRYYQTDGTDIHWTCMRALLESPCRAVLFPLQDLLGLGSEARMNTPGTVGAHNWTWRFQWEQLRPEMVSGLRHICQEAKRGVFGKAS